jgi:hypothetical protein
VVVDCRSPHGRDALCRSYHSDGAIGTMSTDDEHLVLLNARSHGESSMS